MTYTNFSRWFSNLEAKGPDGDTIRTVGEARYANISMFAWTNKIYSLG